MTRPDKGKIKNKTGAKLKIIPPDESESDRADRQLEEVTSSVYDKSSELEDVSRGVKRSS